MSKPAAVLLGAVFILGGLAAMLVAAGVFRPNAASAAEAPAWVMLAAGLAFIFCGATVIVGFAVAGGAGPDGDLPPGTPPAVRFLHYSCGLGFIASLAAVFTWIAFGTGERHFSGALALGPLRRSAAPSGSAGRTLFGLGAMLLWIVLLGVAATAGRRLLRRRG
jgi:hypothetical protein